MNETIRNLFPALEKYVYLNSAAVAPLPTVAVEAVGAQLRDVSMNGSANYVHWIHTKQRARELIAEMLRVRADQIAFMRNTSDGFSAVANGLDWAEGDNIVSFEREFPANFYPWRMIRDRFGVELRLCHEREGRIDLNEFLALIDANTRLVAVSAVQFASGFRADLERIGREARWHRSLLAVDIIQGFGAMPFDLPAQFVDIAAGASHKWLCAPEGCGILYLSDRARERIDPATVGWISVESPWDFDRREQPWKPNALAWESGTGASSLFYGLEQSLKLLHGVGAENIENYLETLSDYLCELLRAKNYRLVSSRAKGEKSQIVCFLPKVGQTANELAERLQNENVIVSPRGERVRVAPHFFNNVEDLEKLAKALP
jgi:cysteine desulfurase / selenocysteine lyase